MIEIYEKNQNDFPKYPALVDGIAEVKNSEIFLRQICRKFDTERLAEELEKKDINLKVEKISATAAAFDLIFVLQNFLLLLFVSILASYIYDKFRSGRKDKINYAIFIRTEKKEIVIHGEKTWQEWKEELDKLNEE